MKHTILVGHNLAKGGGITFIYADNDHTAKEFDTLHDARKYIADNLDDRIWTTYILIPAPL